VSAPVSRAGFRHHPAVAIAAHSISLGNTRLTGGHRMPTRHRINS
jgi:hypothetical protein